MATAPDRLASPAQAPPELRRWVEQVASRTRPEHIHWCDGSDAEYGLLIRQMLASKDLLELNPATHPGCYLHRSHPSDVARVEHLTFVCSEAKEDAGPNNHWMAPAEARRKMEALFDGCMRGRTMYVIPYCMGPIDWHHRHRRRLNYGAGSSRSPRARDLSACNGATVRTPSTAC